MSLATEKTLVCNTLAEMFPEINDVVANGGDLKAFLASKLGGQDDDEDDSEMEPEAPMAKNGTCAPMKTNKETATVNHNKSQRRLSFTELLDQSGTEEDRAVWNHAVEIEREERVKLLGRLTANCADNAEKKELWDEFKALPLKKLRLLANRAAPAREESRERGSNGLFGVGRRIPDYGGSAGSVPLTGNRRRASAEDDDVLDLPNPREILANESA